MACTLAITSADAAPFPSTSATTSSKRFLSAGVHRKKIVVVAANHLRRAVRNADLHALPRRRRFRQKSCLDFASQRQVALHFFLFDARAMQLRFFQSQRHVRRKRVEKRFVFAGKGFGLVQQFEHADDRAGIVADRLAQQAPAW